MGGKQVKFQEEVIREFEETTPFNRAEIAHTFNIFRSLYENFEKYTMQQIQDDVINSPHHIITPLGFANPECAISIEFITENFKTLLNNPFKNKICQAFCTSDNGLMSFTEFLDMVSSFSPKADIEKKIFHAFQIFDIDGDGLISRQDMYTMIDLMAGEDNEDVNNDRSEWNKLKCWIVDGVFFECHKKEKEETTPKRELEERGDEERDHTDHRGDLEMIELDGADDLGNSTISVREKNDEDKSLRSKDTLTIEDFRYCIYRSPDFKNTFSFNI